MRLLLLAVCRIIVLNTLFILEGGFDETDLQLKWTRVYGFFLNLKLDSLPCLTN